MKKGSIFIWFLLAALCAASFYGHRLYKAHVISSRFSKAEALRKSKELKQAAALFSMIMKEVPEAAQMHTESLFALAMIASEAKEADQMLHLWGKVLALSQRQDQKETALLETARAFMYKGDMDSGLEYVSNLLGAYPSSQLKEDASFLLVQMYYQKNDFARAAQLLADFIENNPGAKNMEQALDMTGDINMKLLFSRKDTGNSIVHTAAPGDSLAKIAKDYSVPLEFLLRCNGMQQSYSLRVGDNVKIPQCEFSILVDKSKNTLTLFNKGRFFKRYFVGTGQQNSTPVGDFKVTSRLKDPVWYKPGGGVIPFGSPENLLGTRWMGINYPGYGIHGTWDEQSIGKQSSAGCIRLLNKDVEELYDIIAEGTPVKIVN